MLIHRERGPSWGLIFFSQVHISCFSDFSMSCHSLNLEKVLAELFSRNDDGSDLLNWTSLSQTHVAEADFQVVFGGAGNVFDDHTCMTHTSASTATREVEVRIPCS